MKTFRSVFLSPNKASFFVALVWLLCGVSNIATSETTVFAAAKHIETSLLASSATATKPAAATTTSAAKTTTTRTRKPKKVTSPPVPIFDEVCETTGVTLTRFMNEVAILNPELKELTILFGAINTACKAIKNLLKKSQLPSTANGTLGGEGEDDDSTGRNNSKKLNAIANDLLKKALQFTGKLSLLVSEEEDSPVDLTGNKVGSDEDTKREIVIEEGEKYIAVFDPLDGWSNVGAGIPTGTIIGIYDHNDDDSCGKAVCAVSADEVNDEHPKQEKGRGGRGYPSNHSNNMDHILQSGTNLVAAAYCLYSSSTFFTLTLGNGVFIFTLDETIGEFVLSKAHVRIPENSSIYSLDEARSSMWDEPLKRVLMGWRNGTGNSQKKFSSRYIGSMVADIHRTLLYGGVFAYPRDRKYPRGKLHLLYEAAPMSFLMEQAGGISTTGTERIMDIAPQTLHERVPVFMGSKSNVQEIIDAYSDVSSTPATATTVATANTTASAAESE